MQKNGISLFLKGILAIALFSLKKYSQQILAKLKYLSKHSTIWSQLHLHCFANMYYHICLRKRNSAD